MKGFTSVILFFLFFGSFLGADTVLVLSQIPAHSDNPEGLTQRYSYIENGLMDILFEEGHILFGEQEVMDNLTSLWDRSALREYQKMMAADHVIALKVLPEPEGAPGLVYYQFSGGDDSSDLRGDSLSLLGSGTVDELCYDRGVQIAQEFLEAVSGQ